MPGRIGIVWSASIGTPPQTGLLPNRSIDLTQLIPLFQIPEFHYVCAQKEVSREDANLLDLYGVERPEIENFMDTVKILERCERVICIDTSVAHLSASMGIPTWVLLHYNACWKWSVYRIDSPWYPSIRLFRQKTRNDWDEPLQEIAQELATCRESQEVPFPSKNLAKYNRSSAKSSFF